MFSSIVKKLWHVLLVLCVSFIIFFAISISIIRIVMPKIEHHNYLQHLATHILKTPVKIGQVTTGWNGLQPSIYLNHLALINNKTGRVELKIKHLGLQINLLSSLLHWQLLPSRLTINGAQLSLLKNKNGRLYLSGLAQHKDNVKQLTELNGILAWLLTQSDITLSHININYLNKAQLDNIEVRIRNDFFNHHAYGFLTLPGKSNTHLQLIASLTDGDDSLKNLNGDVYLSIPHFSHSTLTSLQSIFKGISHYKIQNLDGSIKTWLHFSKSHLKHIVMNLIVSDLKTQQIELKQFVTRIDASVGKTKTGYNINAQEIGFSDGNLVLNAQLNLQKENGQLPIIDFISAFKLTDLAKMQHYLPLRGVNPGLLKWVKQAFYAGNIDHGMLLYRGSLKGNNHQFEMTAQLHQLAISYAPKWPLARDGDVNVFIHNNLLTASSQSIQSMGNWVDQLHITLPLKKHTALDLSLHTKTDANKGWNYIEKTPLLLAKNLQQLRFKGPVDFQLALHIPLHKKPHHDETTNGSIKVADGELILPQWNVIFSKINGTLKFHNKSLYDDGNAVSAYLFSNPLTVHVKTDISKDKQHTIRFDSEASLSTQNIRDHFPLPLTQFFDGSSLFAADLVIHEAKDKGNDLHIATNLVGVKSRGLPEPFSKNAIDARPLTLDITMRKDKPLYLKVNYANLASCAMIYDKTQHGLKFRSGNIQIGGAKANYLSTPGLIINGDLKTLDWAHWQKFLDQLLAAQEKNKNKKVIAVRSLSLYVNKLIAYGNELKNLRLRLTPVKHAWKIAIKNNMADGYIIVPLQHQNKWQLNFQYLHLKELKKYSKTEVLSPLKLPPFDININDFQFAGNDYGSVELTTMRMSNGMMIKNLELNSKTDSLFLRGAWVERNKIQHVTASGTLKTNDFGRLISQWKKKSILGGEGNLNFSLFWQGSPLKVNWPSVNGSLSFNLKNGSILVAGSKSQAEIGLGRLLNLLSIDALFSRVETGFKDVTQKGLWFDSFEGDFTLQNGIAHTNDILFKGPVAQISANGYLNLARQTSNMKLHVTPQLTSSVPLIVGVLGGPLAGAAAWMVNKMVGQEIDKLSASTYTVTGPFKKLKIAKAAN